MSSEVEIRIMIRDGTATVGGGAVEADLPAPDAAMGSGETAEGNMAAPSPMDSIGAGAASASAGAPSPTSLGAFEGVAASGELPTPLPLDEVAQLTGGPAATSSSDAPAPDDSEG